MLFFAAALPRPPLSQKPKALAADVWPHAAALAETRVNVVILWTPEPAGGPSLLG